MLSSNQEVRCPTCRCIAPTRPELNGVGRPTGRLLIQAHSGNRWGRLCKVAGDVVEGYPHDRGCCICGKQNCRGHKP